VRAIAPPSASPVVAAAVGSAPAAAPGAQPLPAELPPSTAAVASSQRMFVQVGAFSDQANAARLVERLRASGFGNPVVVSDMSGRREMHRVRLGPIRDSQEFDQLSARLRSVGFADARLVTGQ